MIAKTRWLAGVAVFSVLALFGCQSDRDGFERLCASADECMACRGTRVAQASLAVTKWMDDHVSNGTALRAYRQAALASDRQVGARGLRDAASAAGVEQCALADYLANPRSLHLMWGSTDINAYDFLAENPD